MVKLSAEKFQEENYVNFYWFMATIKLNWTAIAWVCVIQISYI